MKDVIFREYDIRGIIDQELFIDHVYDLTRAIMYYFHEKNHTLKSIAVGMDGRIHSDSIKQEICRAITASGFDVIFIGVCPTPALYFSLFTMSVDGGLMITASHNAKEYNGIKICLGTTSVWGTALQSIKELYKKKAAVTASRSGTIYNHPIIPSYVAWLAHHFNHLKNLSLPMVIDCGNGAGGTVLPSLITALQWQQVTLLYAEVDGTYPHHEADPTVAANMRDLQHYVRSHHPILGIGLDGDCDRMVPMTQDGQLVPGDQLLALFAQQLLQTHPKSSIVFDIKSSGGLHELISQWHGNAIMSPSGHSIIKDMMHTHNALLGGELSCHFFFKDRYFGYDDGIYALLRLCEIIHQSQQSLSQLLSLFPHKYSSTELRLCCPDEKKQEIIAKLKTIFATIPQAKLLTLDGIRLTLPSGWGLIRPSNTQAALSMRFESDSKEGLRTIMSLFYHELSSYLVATELQKFMQQMEQICDL